MEALRNAQKSYDNMTPQDHESYTQCEICGQYHYSCDSSIVKMWDAKINEFETYITCEDCWVEHN